MFPEQRLFAGESSVRKDLKSDQWSTARGNAASPNMVPSEPRTIFETPQKGSCPSQDATDMLPFSQEDRK
ncbi:MAG TPA: hypothetical protein DCP92_16255 [Nitrospiraceae bacterium]|nr:hypothetical protein [Nitrospiraceae bacterium]